MAELSKDVAVGEPTGAGPRLYIDRRGARDAPARAAVFAAARTR